MSEKDTMTQLAKEVLETGINDSKNEESDDVTITVGASQGKPEADDKVEGVTPEITESTSATNINEVLASFVQSQQEGGYVSAIEETTDAETIEKRKIAQEHPDWSISQIDAEYLKRKNPVQDNETADTADDKVDVVVVKIDKCNEDKIAFSEEEQRKLSIAKSIRLVAVEDKNLSTIKIKKAKPREKAKFMKNLDKAISKHSVPLPVFGDFVQFKGAQTITLITNIINEDDSMSESLTKKASLLYECLCGGANIEKTNERGELVLTIDEFADRYPYPDISMGLYGIFCASSKATGITDLQCRACNGTFKHEYRIKNFLRFDNIPDKWAERIDKILTNKGNVTAIKELVEAGNQTERIQSTETGNVYDLTVPSIGKAKTIFDQIDESDPQNVYYASLLLYLENILLPDWDNYNPNDEDSLEYISYGRDLDIEESRAKKIASKVVFTDEEAKYNPVAELFDLLQQIPEIDLKLIANRIAEMYIEPNFAIVTKCPHCGKEVTVNLDLQNMLFLLTQAISTEIE